MYDARSSSYDDSWHPALAAEYVTLPSLQPGQHVLDLACGTGLVSLLAKKAVGDEGSVTGIDVSEGMMALAKEKAEQEGLDIKWLHHDIADLESCEGLREGGYDLITCCSALVLLEDPASAVRQWTTLLKLGGRFITDVPTEDSQLPGLIMNEVAQELGIKVPYNRLWVNGMDSLKMMMKEAGPDTESCWRSDEYGSSGEYPFNSGGAVFDKWVDLPVLEGLGKSETRGRARSVFIEKWKSYAEPTGVVRDLNHLYIAVGRRA